MEKAKKKTTLENILNVAQELFLNRGFAATSLDEICKHAKVTKGGFFHYFRSKECLAKKVLERFCSNSRDHIRQAGCCDQLSDPLDRAFALLDGITHLEPKKKHHGGCLIATFIQELSMSHPEIQTLCVRGLKELASMLEVELQCAQQKYKTQEPLDIHGLANYCVVVIEGAQVMAKANGNKKIIQASIEHLKKYLLTLFTSNKGGRNERNK